MEDFRFVLIGALVAILAIRLYKKYFVKPKDEIKSRDKSAGKDEYEPYSGN